MGGRDKGRSKEEEKGGMRDEGGERRGEPFREDGRMMGGIMVEGEGRNEEGGGMVEEAEEKRQKRRGRREEAKGRRQKGGGRREEA